jgi:hypothetical protein
LNKEATSYNDIFDVCTHIASFITSTFHGAHNAWPYLVAMVAAYGVIWLIGVLTLKETKDTDLA